MADMLKKEADSAGAVATNTNVSSHAAINRGTEKAVLAAIMVTIVMIFLVAVAVVFVSSIGNTTTHASPPTAAITQPQQSNTTSVAPSNAVNQTNASYIKTIYYAGSNLTISPGGTSGVQFIVSGNASANLTGAFSMAAGSVYVAVLNSTEYTNFAAYPGDITTSKYYLGHASSENISVIIPPGTYTLAFFNPNASANAQYNISITKQIALYTT